MMNKSVSEYMRELQRRSAESRWSGLSTEEKRAKMSALAKARWAKTKETTRMKTQIAKAATEKANAATQRAQASRKYKDHVSAAWAHGEAIKSHGECLSEKTTYKQEVEIQGARGRHQAMANWHWKKAATERM